MSEQGTSTNTSLPHSTTATETSTHTNTNFNSNITKDVNTDPKFIETVTSNANPDTNVTTSTNPKTSTGCDFYKNPLEYLDFRKNLAKFNFRGKAEKENNFEKIKKVGSDSTQETSEAGSGSELQPNQKSTGCQYLFEALLGMKEATERDYDGLDAYFSFCCWNS